MTDQTATLDIKPSPRILQVLGDIEFEPWQCIAELIDNAFDDFLEVHRSGQHWPDGFKVSISLPEQGSGAALLRVEDTGRGMDVQTLNNAVRAGWSSNDRFTKLGLFGMGFNIATARLGKLTRIFTTRSQDPEWIGVEIDLDKIGADFHVPLLRRPKTAPSEHGTIIEIGKLEPSRAAWLAKRENATKLRTKLGNIYSPILSERPFQLYLDEVTVRPRKACVWSDTRSVTHGSGSNAEQIPAIIRFDHEMPAADACVVCGNFQPPGNATCIECGGDKLELRTRRIHGWVGIQRYLHKSEYGIDFIRNGRKILAADKRLFSWQDHNDPLATPNVEYPIEVGGGRIVGEVHLDHVPVNYQKTAFEWSDRQWIAAQRFIRGDGPFLPREAARLGYQVNDSPLGRLHRGYRRNDPGRRCLIPGNGSTAIHNDAFEWAKKFHDGVPEYQTDEKWWQAVEEHEAKVAGVAAPPTTTENGGDVIAELGLAGPTELPAPAPAPPTSKAPTTISGSTKKATAPETDKDRADRLKAVGQHVPSLSKDFGITDLGMPLEVTTYAVKEPITDAAGHRAPVWLYREAGKKHLAFVDQSHPFFKSFPLEPAFVLAIEIAQNLKVRADSPVSLSEVFTQLAEKNLGDMRVEQVALAGLARDLLETIRQRMTAAIKENPDRAWQHLSKDERAATETSLVVAGDGTTLDQAQKTGEFMLHVPGTFVARLLDEWPEAFLDGKVFRAPYDGVISDAGRQISVGRVVSYIYDVAVVADSPKALAMPPLARAALSIQLLRTELAPSVEG